jgi:pyruvate/2-oxoglutarate dehydrogenase complex dihydrolipoamide dehydrogenase (E3) component
MHISLKLDILIYLDLKLFYI